MLKTTPFHSRTAPLVRAQTWRRWAGYQVASAYDPHPDREYAAIRSAAALIDVSPLYKYHITGRDAERLLDRMVTRDMTRCAVGQVVYTPWCDGRGKVIDDGTVSRLDERAYRLTSGDSNLRWLALQAAGLRATVEDVSEQLAALALQGPLARAIMQRASPADFGNLGYFRVMDVMVRDIPVTVSRTGYTGDLGYELWVEAGQAEALWDAIMNAGRPLGITPAGIWALDLARIEAGLVMLDVDYHSAHRALIPGQTSTPFELNLGWAVSPTKGPFTGRRALREERARGPAWQFVGLDVEWESLERLYARHRLPPHLPTMAWRTSVPVYLGATRVGYASSGTWSPLLKRSIALAHLQTESAAPGTRVRLEVTVEHERVQADAVVRSLPFFDPARKRA